MSSTDTSNTSNDSVQDHVLRFLLADNTARGQITRLDTTWRDVLATHRDMPAVVQQLLGELCAAGALLAASLKFDGSVLLQLHGDGPVQLVVVEADARHTLRAAVTLKHETQRWDAATWAGLSTQQLLNTNGRGRFSLILDPNNREQGQQPYQGIVPLQGDSVAEMLETYMAMSEQLPTRILLQSDQHYAAGVIVQQIARAGGTDAPNEPTDARPEDEAALRDHWATLLALLQTVGDQELLTTPPDVLMHRLFWNENVRALESQHWRFSCRCNRDKVGGMLQMLGAQEIESILEEQARVEIRCQFCNQLYHFDPIDCARLFLPSIDQADPTATRH